MARKPSPSSPPSAARSELGYALTRATVDVRVTDLDVLPSGSVGVPITGLSGIQDDVHDAAFYRTKADLLALIEQLEGPEEHSSLNQISKRSAVITHLTAWSQQCFITVQTIVGNFLVLFIKIVRKIDKDWQSDENYFLRKELKQNQFLLCRRLIELSLETRGVHQSLRVEKLRLIDQIIEDAVGETAAIAEAKSVRSRKYNTVTTKLESAIREAAEDHGFLTRDQFTTSATGHISRGSTAQLSADQIVEIRSTGLFHKWQDRDKYFYSPFKWIREHYGQWLGKGLKQNHIFMADPNLYYAMKKRITKEGLPADLDLPSAGGLRLKESFEADKLEQHLRARGLSRAAYSAQKSLKLPQE